MLLTLSTTRSPATDLGYLLHKNPARVQSFDLNFGRAHVFYPQAGERLCTAALLLDVDPVWLVRGRRGPAGEAGTLDQYAAATVIEVIEHLDPPRLAAFGRVLFEFARPKTVILTTPNREYNVKWPTLSAGSMRHRDHRFEWTRAEFADWARSIAERFGYAVRFLPVGADELDVGSPTQMGVFTCH